MSGNGKYQSGGTYNPASFGPIFGNGREDPRADVPPAGEEEDQLTPEERAEEEALSRHRLPRVQWLHRRLHDREESELPERLWVVPDWIPREQVTGLYGPPGTNKTDFLIQLMMALSAGLPFMGYQLERMPTYGLFCEDTDVEIARRAARIASHYGMWLSEFPDFHYASLVGYSDLEFVQFDRNRMDPQPSLKRFDKKIEEISPGLACLDTAPHFFGGSEIDRRQVSRFLRKLDAISIARNCSIVITAHPSARGAKAGGRMDSGSTGWEGGVRARIALTKPAQEDDEEGRPPADTNDRLLTLWKSNYAPPGKTAELVWKDGVFTTGALDSEKAKKRGTGRNSACDEGFLEMLRAVVAQGGYVNDSPNQPARYAPAVFASRPDGKEFSKPEYQRAMMRLLGAGRLRYDRKSRFTQLVEATTQGDQKPQPEGDSTASDVYTTVPPLSP